jgi:hypothetical protein
MFEVIRKPGSYCDVAEWIDGRILLTVSDGLMVRCYLEGTLIWEMQASEVLLRSRCAVQQGTQMVTIHQGHDTGSALLVGNGWERSFGPTFSAQPVGITAHEAYVVRSAPWYSVIGLITDSHRSPAPESSQGISDVQPDGTVWFADLHREIRISGVTFTFPNVRGPVTVGQVETGYFTGIAAAIGNRVSFLIPGDAWEPHVVVTRHGRVGICARTPTSAAYVHTTLLELAGE